MNILIADMTDYIQTPEVPVLSLNGLLVSMVMVASLVSRMTELSMFAFPFSSTEITFKGTVLYKDEHYNVSTKMRDLPNSHIVLGLSRTCLEEAVLANLNTCFIFSYCKNGIPHLIKQYKQSTAKISVGCDMLPLKSSFP